MNNYYNKRYKYAHIFLQPSISFNFKLLKLIFDPENGFSKEEHLFVSAYKPLYNETKNRCHIEYCKNPGYMGIDMINMYGNRADWLIVHSFPGQAHRLIFKVEKKYLSKIIWRTWGHDVGDDKYIRFYSPNLIKDFFLKIYGGGYYLFHKILYFMGKRRLQNLYAVGVGNIIDVINIGECYGLTKTYNMPYSGKDEYEILKKLPLKEYDGYYHVMVGHSGFATDRHCEVIDVLKPYEKEKIMIHLILSYGSEEYIQKVKKYTKDFWHGKIEIFEDTVEFEEYAKYMNKMDAVILDGLPSYALGNLSMILFLKKKLFLNRNGVLKKGLLAENIPFHYTDEISSMSFEEFSSKEEYTLPEKSTLVVGSYESCVESWKKLFEDLDKEIEHRKKG